MTISKSLVKISKSLVMISKSLVNYSNSRNNIFQYIKLLVITSINVIFIIILIKIILYNYFKKSKKQIELNSAGIDSRIVSNDNINLKFEETINELKNQLELNSAFINTLIENNDNTNLKFEETANVSKQHMLDNNIDIYNHIANIKNQFYSETAKISDCISNIQTINNNIIKAANNKTKINVLVEKINKYFEFFRELDLKKGETYKKKIYFEFKRINPQTNAELNLYDGFDCFSSVDPYDAEVDRQLKIVCDGGNEFKKNNIRNITTIINNSGMGHIKLMNRNSVRLLDETDEEFEIKILQHILYELQDKYVFYKQIEFYTKPLEK